VALFAAVDDLASSLDWLGPAVISIVDDDTWARSGLSDLVLSLGYEARSFESAEQYIQSGRITETICLITDLHMSGLSGLDLQSHLRSRGHRTPVIFVTAYPTEKHRNRAFAEGAAGFLTKPFVEKALIACLARAMQ
jgi:FixJ family two-component response regulator